MATVSTNGTANGTLRTPPRDVRRRLQEQLAAALTEGKYRKARRITESLLLWDDFGGSDLWDQVRPSSNDGPDSTRWLPLSVPSDRRHGARWPIFRNHWELDELRQQARVRIAGNAHAQGLLKNLTNNVIGKGFAYTATPILPKGAQATPEQEAGAARAQEVIDDFLRLNNWNGGTHSRTGGVVVATREREIYRRVKGEDGEAFLRLHRQPDGMTLVRFIEPERVRDMDGTPQEGWSFGIRHQMSPFEDVETPEEYRVFWPDPSAPGGDGDKDMQAGTWQDVDAEEVVHIKGPDTPATVKRGLSAFLFDMGKALDRAARLQRNASLGAAYRAATGEIWQHQTGTQAQITALAAGLGETNVETGDGSLETVERIRAPAIRRVPKDQELVPLPPDQSESYLAAGQGDLQQAGAAVCAPAYWFGDTGNVNYNNAESAAAPAVRDGVCEQEYYKAAFACVVWKAVMWAVECGKLPASVEQEIKLEVEAPAVLHRNEFEKAQEDQIGVTMGWTDRQRCAEARGFDWDEVQRRNQEYNDQQLQQQADAQEMLTLPGEGEGPPRRGQPGPKNGELKPRVATPPPGQQEKPKPPENLQIKPRVATAKVAEGYDPSEKRDDSGQWTSGGGGKAGRTEMDDSFDEWADNADRVSQNPEKASDKDLRRAIGYFERVAGSMRASGKHDAADSMQVEADHFKGILRGREKSKPRVATNGKKPKPPEPAPEG